MSYQKKSFLVKLVQFVLMLAAFLCFFNAVGCVYMQRMLKANAMIMMREVLSNGSDSLIGHSYTVSAQALGVTSSAELTVTNVVNEVGAICVEATLCKNGKFGFIFPMNLGGEQQVQACISK